MKINKSLKIISISLFGFVVYTVVAFSLPVYHYESSDRGFAEVEVPWKGRQLSTVEYFFNQYRIWKKDPSIRLFRTSKRKCLAPNVWIDNLTNKRWSIPYMEPSINQKSNYYFEMQNLRYDFGEINFVSAQAICETRPSPMMTKETAEKIMWFYFMHNISGCGCPGEPIDEGECWTSIPRTGVAGRPSKDPIRLYKASGRISWGMGPGYASLKAMVKAAS